MDFTGGVLDPVWIGLAFGLGFLACCHRRVHDEEAHPFRILRYSPGIHHIDMQVSYRKAGESRQAL